jgi:hypothetical protein
MTPELRLKEINEMPGMWKPPTPYKCEFAKSVHNAGQKKEAIYKVLSQFRINPNYKFFRVSMEEVRTIFDLMDGDYWGGGVESCDVECGDVECGDIYDIPRATANDMDIDNILEKKNFYLFAFYGISFSLAKKLLIQKLVHLISKTNLVPFL